MRGRLGAGTLALALMAGSAVAQDADADDARSHDARFLAANVEWILDHELAHALIYEFDLPVLGQEEDAADSFASASVSARHPEREAAERLALVAEAWFLEAERTDREGGPDYFGEHDLDRQRAFRVLCVANGADPAVADGALALAEVPDGGFDGCEVDRDMATESWDVLIGPHTLFDDEPPADVAVVYEPTDGLEAEREALEATGAMEALADEAAETYALFDPLDVVGRACGEPDAYHDAEAGEVVICYELVADLLALRVGRDATDGPATEADEGEAPPIDENVGEQVGEAADAQVDGQADAQADVQADARAEAPAR